MSWMVVVGPRDVVLRNEIFYKTLLLKDYIHQHNHKALRASDAAHILSKYLKILKKSSYHSPRGKVTTNLLRLFHAVNTTHKNQKSTQLCPCFYHFFSVNV